MKIIKEFVFCKMSQVAVDYLHCRNIKIDHFDFNGAFVRFGVNKR